MMEIFCTNADDAPSLPGAYILAIEITKPVMVTLPDKPGAGLDPGRYLYCGSAKGPGGIRARLGRHMRCGKVVHWHVDHITELERFSAHGSFPPAMSATW
jgi:Uri superfamily endonuclease